jgi:hypothetical protein
MHRYLLAFLLFGVCFLLGSGIGYMDAQGSKKSAKKTKTQEWRKVFYSKKPFGQSPKSKLRNKWVQIQVIRPSTQLMRELFGDKVPIRCRLSTDDLFECEGTGLRDMLLVQASSPWPAGNLLMTLQVTPQGLTMEISNKWQKSKRWVKKTKDVKIEGKKPQISDAERRRRRVRDSLRKGRQKPIE